MCKWQGFSKGSNRTMLFTNDADKDADDAVNIKSILSGNHGNCSHPMAYLNISNIFLALFQYMCYSIE